MHFVVLKAANRSSLKILCWKVKNYFKNRGTSWRDTLVGNLIPLIPDKQIQRKTYTCQFLIETTFDLQYFSSTSPLSGPKETPAPSDKDVFRTIFAAEQTFYTTSFLNYMQFLCSGNVTYSVMRESTDGGWTCPYWLPTSGKSRRPEVSPTTWWTGRNRRWPNPRPPAFTPPRPPASTRRPPASIRRPRKGQNGRPRLERKCIF